MAKEITAVSMLDILPPNLLRDEKIKTAAEAIDKELQKTADNMKWCLYINRTDDLPEKALDLLAWQWHVDFYEPLGMDIETKRRLIKNSIPWHRIKGTPAAVEQVVSAAFDTSTVKEWFEYGGKPYYFKIITEDVTTNTDTIERMKRAIKSVKNTRSWLEKIEFILHMRDDYGEINEEFSVHAQHSMADNYPWEYRKYDGGMKYGRTASYSGGFSYNGELTYNMGVPGTQKYNAITVDNMSTIRGKLNGFREEYKTCMEYDGKNTYGGVQRYAAHYGPQDQGGEVTIRKGITYNGARTYGGNWTRYTGAEAYNGRMIYDGGDVRRYKFTERTERF